MKRGHDKRARAKSTCRELERLDVEQMRRERWYYTSTQANDFAQRAGLYAFWGRCVFKPWTWM